MGTLISGAMIGGCGEEPQQEVSIFKNQQECIAGGFTAEQCAKMEADAKANSPKFSRREECEAEFGKEMCSGGTDSTGSFWMPALMGFMVGNMLSGNNGGNVTNNYINQDRERDRDSSRRTSSAVVPNNTAANNTTAKPAPVIANGLYNNPDKPGTFKSSNGKSITASPLGKAVVPRSTATFRGGFSGGGRVATGGFGGQMEKENLAEALPIKYGKNGAYIDIDRLEIGFYKIKTVSSTSKPERLDYQLSNDKKSPIS